MQLKQIVDITGVEAVTKTNDSTGLYGKEGSFKSCIYFTIKDINSSEVKGNSIVAKGTDAGGAVEIYETANEAMARC